jgi:hypothetical protein
MIPNIKLEERVDLEISYREVKEFDERHDYVLARTAK